MDKPWDNGDVALVLVQCLMRGLVSKEVFSDVDLRELLELLAKELSAATSARRAGVLIDARGIVKGILDDIEDDTVTDAPPLRLVWNQGDPEET
jgi:hypothetical protein